MRRFLSALVLGALLLISASSQAQTAVDVRRAQVEILEDGVYLVAAVSFELPKSLEDAVQRGSPLFFTSDAIVRRNRWYWLDEKLVEVQRVVRMEYVPLLRRYRVSTGGLNQSVDTLAEALALAQSGIRIKLAERGQLQNDERYRVDFVYKLDTSRMHRLFQIGAAAQRDMQLETERRINFRLADKIMPPAPPEPEKPTDKGAEK
jgi:uncharacterized protein YcfL